MKDRRRKNKEAFESKVITQNKRTICYTLEPVIDRKDSLDYGFGDDAIKQKGPHVT